MEPAIALQRRAFGETSTYVSATIRSSPGVKRWTWANSAPAGVAPGFGLPNSLFPLRVPLDAVARNRGAGRVRHLRTTRAVLTGSRQFDFYAPADEWGSSTVAKDSGIIVPVPRALSSRPALSATDEGNSFVPTVDKGRRGFPGCGGRNVHLSSDWNCVLISGAEELLRVPLPQREVFCGRVTRGRSTF